MNRTITLKNLYHMLLLIEGNNNDCNCNCDNSLLFTQLFFIISLIGLFWSCYWYRKTQKVKRVLGDIGWIQLDKAMLNHEA